MYVHLPKGVMLYWWMWLVEFFFTLIDLIRNISQKFYQQWLSMPKNKQKKWNKLKKKWTSGNWARFSHLKFWSSASRRNNFTFHIMKKKLVIENWREFNRIPHFASTSWNIRNNSFQHWVTFHMFWMWMKNLFRHNLLANIYFPSK